MKVVRAKFRVSSVTHHHHGQIDVKLTAVAADDVPENQRYHKYTPHGELDITIDNPATADHFVAGREMYLDFSTVPAPVDAAPAPSPETPAT